MNRMSREQVESRIKGMIMEINPDYDEALLDSNTSLAANEQAERATDIDSLALAELLITIEEEFHIKIPDKVATELVAIKDLVDYVMEHMT